MDKFYQPNRIDIVSGSECNLSCANCIRTQNNKSNKNDYSKIIKSILENSNKIECQVHFTGGEPFLDLPFITRSIQEIQTLTLNNLNYSIYSNLTILDDDIIKFIKSYNIQIHTSIDGLRDSNDKIRGKGTFDIVLNNIKILIKHGIEINSVTTTLKDDNINLISTDFINELDSLKIETWRLNIDYLGITINPTKLIYKVFSLYVYAIQKGMLVEGTWIYPFNNLISDNKNGFCSATKGETISILPDGKISMCPYSKTILGTFQNDWCKINEEFNIVNQELLSNNRCSGCIIKDYCQTQCLITQEHNKTD